MSDKNDTLWPRRLTLARADGAQCEMELRPLPLREYDRAWAAMDDEFAFAAVCTGCSRDQILELAPDAFEALMAAIRDINARGFFAWSARRQARIAEAARVNMEAIAALPPELAREILANAISPSSSPQRSPSRA